MGLAVRTGPRVGGVADLDGVDALGGGGRVDGLGDGLGLGLGLSPHKSTGGL